MNNDNIIIIYHNPRWGKSRKSVQILDENNKEYQIIEYLKNPLTIKELKGTGKNKCFGDYIVINEIGAGAFGKAVLVEKNKKNILLKFKKFIIIIN